MKQHRNIWLLAMLLAAMLIHPAYAASVPQADTPEYRIGFYAFDNYHMQDADGRRYGYGYEMMQDVANYMQCTFAYIGYDKTSPECEQMLRNGEIDILTAAKITPERQQEFIFTKHPAITAQTCMNVKTGNTRVVAGDYSTYNGLRVGLLRRHTYNGTFEAFAKEKGFTYEILYYDTPTELTNALIHDEVDALVNSYIRTPEDERVVENFGQTPYYIMARKEDRALIDAIDRAIDNMNVEEPNWRSDLYNKYYGAQDSNTEYTEEEQTLLARMQADGVTVRGVMNPDGSPYSWYENGQAKGIAADMFFQTAERLGLNSEIVPVFDRREYDELLSTGGVDVWLDLDSFYEEEKLAKYKITDPYLTTTVSVLRRRGATGKIRSLAATNNHIAMTRIMEEIWPGAFVTFSDNAKDCVKMLLNDEVDGVLLMSYTAQKLARDDIQNRLAVEIVPGASLGLSMGVNADDDIAFYGLWRKALAETADTMGAEIVQSYIEGAAAPTMAGYLFDHPAYLVLLLVSVFLTVIFILLYLQSVRSKNQQARIAGELADALAKAREANEAKQNFFSKMSHDIRTPLNVVLGMTQVAQKYKNDGLRLGRALDSITTEGNHLLSLINSILDVNQLEHGHVELQQNPFSPVECVCSSVEILRPLAEQKEQKLTVSFDRDDDIVVGDANRLAQIMINIISNAIKYTELGGTIAVSVEHLPENRCRFVCRDNGIGMSEEFIGHMFEDYVRAEDSRISKIQGTGLGLSVVKGFTELMQGSLHVVSKEGEGSQFTVEIPFAEATEAQREELLRRTEEDPVSSRKYAGKRVLLVEDNALNAEIAMELLQSIGFVVDWADNGQAGVEQFEASEPGSYYAVFMDMQMPVMDGIDATKAIRKSRRKDRNVPVFAMTANTFASDRKNCMDAGMNGYIAKPIHVKDIVAALKTGVESQPVPFGVLQQ